MYFFCSYLALIRASRPLHEHLLTENMTYGMYRYGCNADNGHILPQSLNQSINQKVFTATPKLSQASLPRWTWLRTTELNLQLHNPSLKSASKLAQDCSKWRQLVSREYCQGRATQKDKKYGVKLNWS